MISVNEGEIVHSFFRVLLAVAVSSTSMLALAQPATAAGAISGYKLEKGKATVPFGEQVTIWSCWEPGTFNPNLYAWTGKSWSRLARGQISTNRKLCNKGDVYVEFTFRVSQRGKPQAGKPYNVVKVKETCRGCDPYTWLLPVRV